MNRRGFISMLTIGAGAVLVPNRKFFLPARSGYAHLIEDDWYAHSPIVMRGCYFGGHPPYTYAVQRPDGSAFQFDGEVHFDGKRQIFIGVGENAGETLTI